MAIWVLWTAGDSATLIIVTLVTPGCNPVLGSELTFTSLVRTTISSVGLFMSVVTAAPEKYSSFLSHGHSEQTIGTID